MNSKQLIYLAYENGWIRKKEALKTINIAKYKRLTCELCKKQMTNYTIDHIIPKSKNGSNDLYNLRLTHEHCNNKRQNKFTLKDLLCLLF